MTLRDDEYREAYIFGKAARRRGEPRSANPDGDVPGYHLSRAWDKGWLAADAFIVSGGEEGVRERYAAKAE